jgi:hypothetical protein
MGGLIREPICDSRLSDPAFAWHWPCSSPCCPPVAAEAATTTRHPPRPAPLPPPVSLAATYTDLVAGTINSPQGWPAWTGTGQPVAGVGCLVNEDYHIHALVSIYKDGVRQGLPDNIGRSGCAYELHTHDVTGTIHIETDVPKKFTLGQLFALWRQPLLASGTAGLAGPIRFYVIDKEVLTPYTGDPGAIELTAHREIVIVSGTPPATLPKYRWPSGI